MYDVCLMDDLSFYGVRVRFVYGGVERGVVFGVIDDVVDV